MTAPLSGPIPAGPPFDLDVLADLHAGVYPEDVAAVLRARAAADPDARAVLALDATVADLHALPPVPIPASVAARLDAAVAAEQAARTVARVVPVGSAPAGIPPTAQHPAALPTGGPVPPSTHASVPPPLQSIRPTTGAPMPPVLPQQHAGPPVQGDAPGSPIPQQPPSGRVSSLEGARRARDQRRAAQRSRGPVRWATGLGIAAAVAAVFTVGAVLLHPDGEPGTGMAGGPLTTTSAAATGASQPGMNEPAPSNGAQPPPADAGSAPTRATTAPGQTRAVVVQPHHLADLLPQIAGKAPAGPFADPARLDACLAANDAAGQDVLGVLPVSYTGQQAYAISLRTDTSEVRILVVGPQCGASGSDLLEEQTTTG